MSISPVVGFGWDHLWVYAFLTLMQVSAVAIDAGFSASCNQWYQIVWDVDFYEYLALNRAMYAYWWIPTLVGFIAVGYVCDKFGRWRALMGISLFTLLLSPLLWAAAGPSMFSAGWMLVRDFGREGICMMLLVYLYEWTPQKHSATAVLAFGMVSQVGQLLIAVIMSSSDYVEITDTDKGMDNWWVIVTAVPFALLCVSMLVGLITVRKDTPVQISYGEWPNKNGWIRFGLCCIASFGAIYWTMIPDHAYGYWFQAYIGESYQFNSLPCEIGTHVCVMIGVLTSICILRKLPNAASYIPGLALCVLAVSCGMLSGVYLYTESGDSRKDFASGEYVQVGVALGLAALVGSVLKSILSMFVLQTFDTRVRGRGMAIYTIVLVCITNSARVVRNGRKKDTDLYSGICIFFAILGVLALYGLVKTDPKPNTLEQDEVICKPTDQKLSAQV